VNSEPVIELREARIAQPAMPQLTSVNAVTWSVLRDEMWVVAGLPGSGKSSLLLAAAALNPLTVGELRLFGQPVRAGQGDAFREIRRRVGVIFEGGGHLFGSATIAENAALPIRYHRNIEVEEAVAEVQPLLELCALTEVAGQNTRFISRAVRQRVALARALAMQPEVLLLDNPLAGLDPGQIRWWRRMIPELRAGHPLLGNRPMTLVVTTDNFRPWIRIADRFAMVHQRTWRILGSRTELEAADTNSLHGLLESEDTIHLKRPAPEPSTSS
jgi:ABC-type transporter Mla maintaining outer membrane lipid asymmetry ATPase subunit MlaF